MAWAFVRPSDDSVLAGRPLLDLGTGDGQTRDALAPGPDVVGVDVRPMRAGDIAALSHRLPFEDGSFATVLAADLFHHLDDAHLDATLREVERVLKPGGRLVAWWLEATPDTAPDAPRYCRAFEDVAERTGLSVERLSLQIAAPNSATVGLLGEKG